MQNLTKYKRVKASSSQDIFYGNNFKKLYIQQFPQFPKRENAGIITSYHCTDNLFPSPTIDYDYKSHYEDPKFSVIIFFISHFQLVQISCQSSTLKIKCTASNLFAI